MRLASIVVPESTPLSKQIISETLWGKRGLVKTANLWLPLALIVSTNASDGRWRVTVTCFQVFGAVACWSLASILANDLTDWRDDRAAGKERWVLRLPRSAGALVVALLVGFGVLVVVLSGTASGALAAYGGAVALGALYSIKPLRLKERGLLGPLAYSLSGTLGFVILPWMWLGSDWRFLAVLTPAVLLDKWVNLHFHQVVDYEADQSGGTRTYAVLAGHERARRSLKWAACFASLSLLAVLAFAALVQPEGWRLAIVAIAGAVVLAVAIYTKSSRQRLVKASALVRELPWVYLGLTYALFRILPPILFARLALLEPTMWLVVGVIGLSLLVESWYSARYHYD